MSRFGSLVKSSASLSVPVKTPQEIPVESCAQPRAVLCARGQCQSAVPLSANRAQDSAQAVWRSCGKTLHPEPRAD